MPEFWLCTKTAYRSNIFRISQWFEHFDHRLKFLKRDIPSNTEQVKGNIPKMINSLGSWSDLNYTKNKKTTRRKETSTDDTDRNISRRRRHWSRYWRFFTDFPNHRWKSSDNDRSKEMIWEKCRDQLQSASDLDSRSMELPSTFSYYGIYGWYRSQTWSQDVQDTEIHHQADDLCLHESWRELL